MPITAKQFGLRCYSRGVSAPAPKNEYTSNDKEKRHGRTRRKHALVALRRVKPGVHGDPRWFSGELLFIALPVFVGVWSVECIAGPFISLCSTKPGPTMEFLNAPLGSTSSACRAYVRTVWTTAGTRLLDNRYLRVPPAVSSLNKSLHVTKTNNAVGPVTP